MTQTRNLRATTLVAAAALVLAACAGGGRPRSPRGDAFYSVPMAAAAPAGVAPQAAARETESFMVELSFERADGARLEAPALVVPGGQWGRVAMVDRVLPVNPETVMPEEGMWFDARLVRTEGGPVQIAYRLRLARVVPGDPDSAESMPVGMEIDRVEASGARTIETGVQGLLARLASPDGSGPILVLARVTESADAPPTPQEVPEWAHRDERPPVSPAGPTVHLRVTAVIVGRDLDPGTVYDETATPDVMKAAGGQILRDFEAFTSLDANVRLAGLLGPPDDDAGSSGLVASIGEDGRLHVVWNGHAASVRPNLGRRFVAIAPVEGGGTAGVLVSVDADE